MKSFSHVQKVRMLYKTILRLHRGLPYEIRSLGDGYVKDEFRRHKKCRQAEAAVFMNEWADYAISLAKQLGLRGPVTSQKLGKHLKTDELDNFSDEQVHQLYELMSAATGKDDSKDNKK